jgi:asparagine synthase (glutamine-hydrolysing)
MCGIFGVWNIDGRAVEADAVQRATSVIRHRGPDDEGFLLADTRAGTVLPAAGRETSARLSLPRLGEQAGHPFDLALGFRRLSILDLSEAGHQPMGGAGGRLWIVFNGEIYNYVELRDELRARSFKFQTGTDTEVILAAYEQWGESCVDRFNGMFAFAVWDAYEQRLLIARDRFGEKPLFYVYEPGRLFAFASEMKALWAAGLAPRRVHEETLARFAQYGQVESGEQTFYEGILRLPQAHTLTLELGSPPRLRRYWDIDPREREPNVTSEAVAERFRELFTDSVRLRLRADVPVGSSLSGGLDSSTVVSVINRLLPAGATQKTFTARFDDERADEGRWAELVASANRVEPHYVWPTGERFFEELDKLFWHQEEPFSSTSVYAQWCVMRLARKHGVTVLLDGQGADEMLAGYHVYFNEMADDLLKCFHLSGYLRWRRDCERLHGWRPGSLRRAALQALPENLKKPARVVWRALKDLPRVEPLRPEYPPGFKKVSGLRRLLWWNTTRQGLVELLRYADRNSMAHSREVRLPFLDHRLVEFIFRLPTEMLVRSGWTKWVLREAFRGVVPAEITDRVDKLGYMPPQGRWLGGRAWPEVMLRQVRRETSRATEWLLEESAAM